MNILIVDDYLYIRKQIISLLLTEFPNIQFFEASDGLEAINMANCVIWDLILLDISMPIKNGIETLKELRDLGIEAPILIISFQVEYNYEKKLLKMGASGYLNKEHLSSDLISIVYSILPAKHEP